MADREMTSEEFARFRSRVKSSASRTGATVTVVEDIVQVTGRSGASSPSADVNLSALEPGARARLRLSAKDEATYKLSHLSPGATVELSITDINDTYGRLFDSGVLSTPALGTPVAVELTGSILGKVVVSGHGYMHLDLGPNFAGSITLESGALSVHKTPASHSDNAPVPVTLRTVGSATPAFLTAGHFNVTMCGALDLVEHQGGLKIEELVVVGRSWLCVAKLKNEIKVIRSHGGQQFLSIGRDQVITQGRPVRTNHIPVVAVQNVRLELAARHVLSVSAAVNDLKISGAGGLALLPNAKATNVAFPTEKPAVRDRPTLSAGAGAIATNLSGGVIVTDVSGATIEGSSDRGLNIRAVKPNPDTEVCAGATLIDFKVANGIEGRKVLDHLDQAYRLEPFSRNFPGWGLRWKATWRGPSASDRDLRHSAELMRKLRELCHQKGASGGLRTKVGWCAQRLRHQSTRGQTERLWLMLYRSLGYGERPGPAFATWLVLSVLFAFALTVPGGWTWDPVAGARVWLERAISPVGTLVGSGNGTEESGWLYLVRALTAIPLVVGALSLRNYVRST